MSDVTLFTMAALIQQNNGDQAAALAQFNANYNAGTSTLNQAFVDQILAQEDILAGVNDPLMTFSVTTPVNNRTGNIHGLELQGQHFFGNTGFGVAGSLTKVFGDVNFDRGSNPGTNVFALTGLSDSFNVTAIFEKYGISARVAYNWRGKFLQAVNRGGKPQPGLLRAVRHPRRELDVQYHAKCADHARGAEPDQRTNPQLRAQHAPAVVRAGAASALLAWCSLVQIRRHCRGVAAASAAAAAASAASGDADLPGRVGDRGYGELPGSSAAAATTASAGTFRPARPVNRPHRRHGKSVDAKRETPPTTLSRRRFLLRAAAERPMPVADVLRGEKSRPLMARRVPLDNVDHQHLRVIAERDE